MIRTTDLPESVAPQTPAIVVSPGNSRATRVIAEALAVAMMPLLAYFLFRLRLMPFPDLNDPAMQDNLRQHAAEHLAKFKADAIAAAYLRVMQKLVG